VHRIGRTGRAGREGQAFMMVTPAEMKALKAIEQLIRQTIAWEGGAIGESEASEHPARRRPAGKAQSHRGASRGKHRAQPHPKPATKAKPSPAKTQSERQVKPVSAAKPVPAAKPAARAAQPVRPHRRPERQPNRDAAQGHGFNDHLPAFLARPVR
jgi:superfamily II DNA/RNA helicase